VLCHKDLYSSPQKELVRCFVFSSKAAAITLRAKSDGTDDHDEEFKPPSSAYQHTFRTPETQKSVSSDTSDEDPSKATVYLTPQPPTNVQPHRKTSIGAKKQEQLPQILVPTNPKTQELLKPLSASAPNSPRLSRRALPITVTSSATVKVATPNTTTQSILKNRKPQEQKNKENCCAEKSCAEITRKRSKSPLPRSGQQNLAVPGTHVSRAPSTTITTSSTARSPRASPSPARAGSTNRTARSVSRGRPTEARKLSQRKPSAQQKPFTGEVPSIQTENSEPEDDDTMAMSRQMSMTHTRKSPGRPMSNLLNRSVSADPNLNDPAIKAKIGNRMTKTVNKTIGNCGICNKVVTDEGCTAFGKFYHKECFKCGGCRQKINGKFFERNGKPYCQKCFMKQQDECCICKQKIKGDAIELAKKHYHPECCKCQICGETVRGRYYVHAGKPICEMDYKSRADKCSVCNEIIVGAYYNIGDKILCEEHYKANAEQCPRCHNDVSGTEIVRITGACFHPACFTCVECDKKLVHESFISDDKFNIYCEDDYNRKKACKCSYCKKPIVPRPGEKTVPRLRALGKDFHPNCFKCEDCGLLLDSRVKGKECYPWRNHVLCKLCNRKKFSSDEESDDD